MIALWMLYAAVIGCLLAAAAYALEHLVAQYGWSRRWVWLIAMAALPVVPLITRSAATAPASAPIARSVPAPAAPRHLGLARAATPRATPAARPAPSPLALGARAVASAAARVAKSVVAVAAMPAVVVRQAQAHQEHLARFDRPLAWLWTALSALLVGVYAVAAVKLRRERRRWPAAQVDGESVLVAPNAGPAVVGLLRPAIVLPAWTLGIDAKHRALILHHEREHMRAHDPLVLHFVTVTTYLVPWNVAMWWMLRRLRIAVELDCDRRVLLAGHDAHRYADLLLAVGQRRTHTSRLLVPALVERQSLLARRILAMCPQRTKFQRLRSSCAAGAAYLMFAAAFAIPMPALKTLAHPASATNAGATMHEARLVVLEPHVTFLADSAVAPMIDEVHPSSPADARAQVTARRPARPGPRGTPSAPLNAELSGAVIHGFAHLATSSGITLRLVTDSSQSQVVFNAKSEVDVHDAPNARLVARELQVQPVFSLDDSSGVQLVPMTLPSDITFKGRGVGRDSVGPGGLVADSASRPVLSVGDSIMRALTSLATESLGRITLATRPDSAHTGAARGGRVAFASMVSVNLNMDATNTVIITNGRAVLLSPAGGVKTAPPAVHP